MAGKLLKAVVTLSAGGALTLGVAAPATAQGPDQDGLVNVAVGDVTVLEDVEVAVAAQVVAQLCDTADVGPVAAGVLGRATAVDRSGRDQTICTSENDPVTIEQN